MRTDRLRRVFLVGALLLTLCLVCSSCSKKGGPPSGGSAGPVDKTESGAADGYALAHFPSFELSVPEHWSVRGNVGKLYEGEGMFLLVGPLEPAEDPLGSLEETLAEELQLFFNTDYYCAETRFQYEEDTARGTLRCLRGSLINDRKGTSLRFAGAFSSTPGAYYVYFWQDASEDRAALQRVEVSYESFRLL